MSGWTQDSLKPEHVILVNTDKVSVVRVATVNKRMPGWQRRAPIIAAAPDLLAACKSAANVLAACVKPAGGCDDEQHMADALQELEAAIAAAEPKP